MRKTSGLAAKRPGGASARISVTPYEEWEQAVQGSRTVPAV
jgi:hypothetical protein